MGGAGGNLEPDVIPGACYGGGGGSGHYEPSGEGLSGAGGPGYVLIEW